MSKRMVLEATGLKELLSEASNKLKEDRRNNFRSICLSSDLEFEDILEAFGDRFEVSPQGEFYELKTSYDKYGIEINVFLYLYQYSEVGQPILFTLNSSEDISRTAEPIITTTEGIYYLWMPPGIVESLKEKILDIEGSRLTYFYGEKFSSKRRFDEERRPEYKRKDEYKGDDAADTLEERKMEYGIFPTRLRFQVPTKAQFQFSNLGEFVLMRGKTDFFFEMVNLGLEKVEGLNNAIQSSNLSVIEEDGIERISKRTLEIEVAHPLDYEDSSMFINEMKDDEFYPYNISKSEGSLLLEGRIVDEKNGGIISLSTDGSVFSLLPKYGSDFDSLMRFFRFMVERIDSDATVELSG